VTLGDIIKELMRDRIAFNDPEIIKITNWLAEVTCNIMHHGSLDFLSSREDKHLFLRREFELMATDAGFARVEAIPYGPDPTGEETLRVYLSQCQVSPRIIDRVCQVLHRCGPKHLTQLRPEDQSPSYLLCLLNNDSTGKSSWTPQFDFNLVQSDEGLKIDGWCISSPPSAWVIAEAAGESHKVPIWRPRPDVEAIVNRDGPYRAVDAICSGVSEVINSLKMASASEIALSAITTTGARIPLGKFSPRKQISPNAKQNFAELKQLVAPPFRWFQAAARGSTPRDPSG
jgi:hypothetical protein